MIEGNVRYSIALKITDQRVMYDSSLEVIKAMDFKSVSVNLNVVTSALFI